MMDSAVKEEEPSNPDQVNISPAVNDNEPPIENILQPEVLSAEQQAHTFKHTPRNVLYNLVMLLSCSYHSQTLTNWQRISDVDNTMYFAPTSWVAYWLKIIMLWFSFAIFLSGQFEFFDDDVIVGNK